MQAFDQPALFNDEVIALRGKAMIFAAADRVLWRDGSTVGLHRVACLGKDNTYLRAVRGSDALWHVVDLRLAVPDLPREYCRAERADRDFLVRYSVRTVFEHAGAFTRWAEAADPAPRRADGERSYTERQAA